MTLGDKILKIIRGRLHPEPPAPFKAYGGPQPYQSVYKSREGFYYGCANCADYRPGGGGCVSMVDDDYGWCGSRDGLPWWRPRHG